MIKSEQSSTMNGGLCMDLSPLITPNDVMTSCLNGTFLTYNGNDNILQNEMGNVRVDLATLPKGYVPVGTVQHGGIIYIASYNPSNGYCQLGSFPSPERNFTPSDMGKGFNYTLGNSTFVNNNDDVITTKVLIPLTEDDLYPGDLYKVFFKKWEEKYDKILSAFNDPNKDIYGTVRYIKLSFATINDQCKLIYLNDYIHWDEISSDSQTYKYYISPEPSNFDQDKSTYNVFSGQEKGKLYVVAELEIIDDFSISWDATRYTNDGEDKVDLTLYANWTSNRLKNKEVINPEFIDIKKDSAELGSVTIMTVTNNGEFIRIDDRKNDGTDSDYKLSIQDDQGNDTPTLEGLSANQEITITATPRMNYGNLKHLEKNITIDLSKVNSGLIKLSEWRYFKSKDNINLEFYVEAYTKKGKEITSLQLKFYKITKNNIESCIIQYSDLTKSFRNPNKIISIVDNTTYSKAYQEIIYFDDTFTAESCYQVDLVANYGGNKSEIVDRRILYTTEQFNNRFNDTSDFGELTLNEGLYPSISTSGMSFDYSNVTSKLQKLVGTEWEDVTESLYYKDYPTSEQLRINTNINNTILRYTIIPAIRYVGDNSIESSLFTFTYDGYSPDFKDQEIGGDSNIENLPLLEYSNQEQPLEIKQLMKPLTYPDYPLYLNYICYKSEGNYLVLNNVPSNFYGEGLAFHKLHEGGDKGTVAYQFYKISELNDYLKASDEYEYDVIPIQFIIYKVGKMSNNDTSGDGNGKYPDYMVSIIKSGTSSDYGSNNDGNGTDKIGVWDQSNGKESSYVVQDDRAGFLLVLCKNKVGDFIPMYVTNGNGKPQKISAYAEDADPILKVPEIINSYYKLVDNDEGKIVNKYLTLGLEYNSYYIDINPNINLSEITPILSFDGKKFETIKSEIGGEITIPNFKFETEKQSVTLGNIQQYKVEAQKLIDKYINMNDTIGTVNDNIVELIPKDKIEFSNGSKIFMKKDNIYSEKSGLSFALTNPPNQSEYNKEYKYTNAIIVDNQVRLNIVNANQSKVILRSTLDDETIKIYLVYG